MSIVPIASNDNFVNAIIINRNITTGSNIGFTGEVGEPAQQGVINSAWWSWTAPATANRVIIDTIGSDFDTVLSVFTGNTVDGLTLVAQNDDLGEDNSKQSRVSFNITPGTTYYLAVDGYGNETGNITLNVSPFSNYNTFGFAIGVQVVGNYAYVADYGAGLQIIDISDPANPTRTGGYDTSGYARGVEVVGNYAYVADSSAGLQIIDISNPANPTRTGGYDTPGSAEGVQVVGNYAYVADEWSGGLQIIDISYPTKPTRTGGYDTFARAYDVQVVGNYAYVADEWSGLQVINISNPANPTLTGGYDTSGFAYGVQVVGNYAYVADRDAGLQIIDISNPANPTRTGFYNTSGLAWSVQVVGNYAYVANGDSGLEIIDISDPAKPTRIGGYNTSGSTLGVQVVGNYAYVADGDAGLQIIDVSEFTQVPTEQPSIGIVAPTNAVQSEGNSGTTPFTFTVTRTGDTGTSSANWAVTGTGDNPANAADFGGTLPTGTVTFADGETSQVITVNVSGDTEVEPDETFTVTLSNPSNATITTATATGTILNDDASLAIAPTNAIRLEGNTGTTPFTFTVTRTGETTGTSSANWEVTATGDNPANAIDFGETLPAGTVSFIAGETSQVITVNVQGDRVFEQDETFTVTLSNPSNATITTATATGTIRNDDLINPPQLLITPESNKVTPGRGEITLNYRLDNFNDSQVSFAGFSIYFDNSQLNINTGDVNLSSSAGTIVSKTIIDDTADADNDPNTDKELILTISPLESTNSDSVFVNIPFTTTSGFDGETTVNFAGSSGNPNVDVLGVPSVTVSGLAADIDGNGRVTGADLLFISQYLLLRNNPNVDAILQSSFNLFSTETVGATDTTGAALRNAIANGVNKLAFDVDGNEQVTGGDIFLMNQGLLLKSNPNVNAILQTSFNLFTSELTGARNTGAEINAFISELLG
ncbi:pre-peptidase C-terminal domain-containing protein [Anabaenopsis sp. FSS-46]|uniref:Calx-beta domain-containing protein n=1 Tax=Anabaenopsis sp. FSS-46 TaxID=2971766 RepID=UPI002474A12D|nr:Calx-beta domain-containing protein [Anabaenopsis sp. FSS-46]MDH6099509.1 pre-peptidase C-terminal domain-containing protein [Anabaenopsis sp. FSS-46]